MYFCQMRGFGCAFFYLPGRRFLTPATENAAQSIFYSLEMALYSKRETKLVLCVMIAMLHPMKKRYVSVYCLRAVCAISFVNYTCVELAAMIASSIIMNVFI